MEENNEKENRMNEDKENNEEQKEKLSEKRERRGEDGRGVEDQELGWVARR